MRSAFVFVVWMALCGWVSPAVSAAPHRTEPALPGPNKTAPTAEKADAAQTIAKAQKAQKARKSQARSGANPSPLAHKGPSAVGASYAQRQDALAWADEAAQRLQLPADWLQAQIRQARRMPHIERLVLPAPSPTAKNWAAYRSRFIEPKRIEAGLAFWQRHASTLARAEETYGVPVPILVGILGVETLYGQHMGQFRILDALSTLAFDFPQAHPRARERQAFFKEELEQFLRLVYDTAGDKGRDATRWRGSYAGAMGLPQFMPSSWRRYAVDFDGDGRIDLFNSPTDAIGSVANYFRAFRWQPGLPTHYPVKLNASETDMQTLLAPDILPTFSVQAFMAKGAQLSGPALQHPGPLALIELRNGEEPPSYVAGTENFYAVTRYNWSSYYAMAVIELGQALAERMGR
jgi:membrane-bound lytic murein transglycosylase B